MAHENDQEWPADQLAALTDLEEVILVLTREGHDPIRVPVWLVTIDGTVYLRSYKGVTSMWFRRVQADPDQAIRLASSELPVHFDNVERTAHVNRAIDAEYNRKYAKYDYVDAMSEPAAVDATLRLAPR